MFKAHLAEFGEVILGQPGEILANSPRDPLTSGDLMALGAVTWLLHGFPTVSLAHSLAADLMLSDVDLGAEAFRAPWPCFVIEVPPNLVSFADGTDVVAIVVLALDENFDPSTGLFAAVLSSPRLTRRYDFLWGDLGDPSDSAESLENLEEWQRVRFLLRKLVENVALIATQPQGDRGPSLVARPGPRVEPATKRTTEAPPSKNYMLSPPVEIAVRSEAEKKEVLAGFRNLVRTGRAHVGRGEQAVRYIKRGHWRNQACGPRWSERRWTWIAPHPVGPKDGPQLVRPHVLVAKGNAA